jgi:hypothetical protein
MPQTMSAFTIRSWLGSRNYCFEACSTFTRVTACLFAKSSKTTLYTEGSDGFVTSTIAPIATGRNDLVAGRDSHPQDLHAFSRRTPRSVTHGEITAQVANRAANPVDTQRRVHPLPALLIFAYVYTVFAIQRRIQLPESLRETRPQPASVRLFVSVRPKPLLRSRVRWSFSFFQEASSWLEFRLVDRHGNSVGAGSFRLEGARIVVQRFFCSTRDVSEASFY